MAVGHAPLPDFSPISGIRIGVANAGVKQTKRPDVAIFEIAEGSTVAGVFTKNAFCAAPVQLCKKHLATHAARYLLINTGNANAGTGKPGLLAAEECVSALAGKVSVNPEEVLPFSTGVIGEPLPVAKIVAVLDTALDNLSADNWPVAATAIMTTDTRPKGVFKTLEIAGVAINIAGISKGAGMIKPNMATMLGYVAVDAKVSQSLLQEIILEATRHSFNRITIDGDTSTNDSAVLIATGASGLDVDSLSEAEQWVFRQAITLVFVELAQLIIRDGEGATKFVHVKVDGGLTEEECEKVAFAVAESPLVKTALFASDPNWGRILAAVGRSGVENLDVSKIGVSINNVLIAENGGRSPSYTEAAGVEALAKENIVIHISLHRGNADATVWTTDLSYDYVKINAEYRS